MTCEELRANGFETDASDEEHDKLMVELFGADAVEVRAVAWAEWNREERNTLDLDDLGGAFETGCRALREGGY